MYSFEDISEIFTLDELENIVKKNILTASNIRKEIKDLDELSSPVSFNKKGIEGVIKNNYENLSDDLSEYEYYYQNIKNIPIGTDLEELKKIIRENLPSKNNSNYFNIILYIKYKIDEEILTYASLIEQCNTSSDISILNDIKICIEYLKIKLSFIDKIDYEVKNNENSNELNNIIFLRSTMGNNYPLSDLESISDDYYYGINELYESIKNNTFKGVKRFSGNNDKISGVSKVRYHLIRIVFDRLNENTYIILQVLIKKTQNDFGYLNTVSTRFSKYNKKEIIDSLLNKDFIEKNKEEQEKFEKILSKKSKGKNLC